MSGRATFEPREEFDEWLAAKAAEQQAHRIAQTHALDNSSVDTFARHTDRRFPGLLVMSYHYRRFARSRTRMSTHTPAAS